MICLNTSKQENWIQAFRVQTSLHIVLLYRVHEVLSDSRALLLLFSGGLGELGDDKTFSGLKYNWALSVYKTR